MRHLSLLLTRLRLTVAAPSPRDERGDVPGWVLVTVMSAALVGVLYQFAGDQLKTMLDNALGTVLD